MNLPPAKLYSRYTATCTATSNSTRPVIHVTLDNQGCHYTTSVVDTDQTKEVTLTIESVTKSCRGVTIKCQANDAVKIMKLDIMEESNTTTTSPTTIAEGTVRTSKHYNVTYVTLLISQTTLL